MHEIRSSLVRGERRGPLASKSPAASAAGKDGSLTAVRIRREETRRCDQRREPRHLNVVDKAVVRHQRRNQEVSVLNVSARGAMIECELVPNIGAPMEIRFAECNPTDCRVRWVRDGRIGLEFVKETLVISANDQRERFIGGRRDGEHPTIAVKGSRAPRQGLILMAQLHTRYGSMTVKLRNISSDGVMLDAPQDLDAWTEVVLEIPGAALPGRVRWCRSRQIGIKFDAPLDLATLGRPEQPPESGHVNSHVMPDYLKSETDPNSPWAARRERLSIDDL